MPKVPKPGTSAEHQRAAEATALKRVKLIKLGHSFDGEDDRILRIRDEYLETLGPSKPTLSAAEADELVAAKVWHYCAFRASVAAGLAATHFRVSPTYAYCDSRRLVPLRHPSRYIVFVRQTASTNSPSRAARVCGYHFFNFVTATRGGTSDLANIVVG
jgi:hypothetical protein